MPIPITLIIDDPAPLVNVFWWHRAEEQNTAEPKLKSGESVVRDIPLDFLKEFVEVIYRWGIKGKFSVVPIPAGLGKISVGWEGCNLQALERWISIVHKEIMPRMDITPEILTHAKTLDLDSMKLLADNESNWSMKQTEATLTPYISYALQLLKDVGLEANGVTSPWDFGCHVEADYQRAIHNSLKKISARTENWYFLHMNYTSNKFESQVVFQSDHEFLVSIVAQCEDYLWNTMEESHFKNKQYISSVADQFIKEDGEKGRLVELYRLGIPMVIVTHWQSLYSNGRRTGLEVLAEVGRRIQSNWNGQIQWLTCSDLAREIATNKQIFPDVPNRNTSKCCTAMSFKNDAQVY